MSPIKIRRTKRKSLRRKRATRRARSRRTRSASKRGGFYVYTKPNNDSAISTPGFYKDEVVDSKQLRTVQGLKRWDPKTQQLVDFVRN